MFGRVSKRRFPATTLFNLFAVTATVGLVAALQHGAGAAYKASVCGNPINSVAASPGAIGSGQSSTITVTLNSAAPTGGCTVDMSYSDTSQFVNPATSVNISGGSTSGSYQLTAQSSPSGANVTITGMDNYNSKQAAILVEGP
ncbi:MAG TPA: hypothetical protein VFA07_05865 [Chthonomonadaceae bacterium]|nr:hypothetical protein [Chthonomonadaceae bacterium]